MSSAPNGSGSVARFGWLIGLAAALAVVFLVLGDVGFRAPPPVDAGPVDRGTSGGRRVQGRPRPDMYVMTMDAEVIADAAWTEESMDETRVRRVGLLGHDAQWIAALMNEPDNTWRAVPDRGGPTFKDERLGTMVTFKLVDNKVTVVRADFSETARSASATALSWIVLGNRMPLPFHLESEQPGDGVMSQTEKLWDGRTVHWRAALQTTGESPYGPAWFEISYQPLP